MSGTFINPGGFTRTIELRNIQIQTVSCPLYDYMVLNKLCDLVKPSNREQLEYYSKRYSLEPHQLISIFNAFEEARRVRNGGTGNIIDFARTLLFERTTEHSTKLVELIKDPDNLVILPTFFQSDTYTTPRDLRGFFTQSEIEKEFKTVSSVLFQQSQPTGNQTIPLFQEILQTVNNGYRDNRQNNVYFLPCIVKLGDKRIKTEKDYLEKLGNSIIRLRVYIRENPNVRKLVFLVDPDNKFSLQFYEQKNSSKKIFSSSIEYLNKHLIAALQKKDTKTYNYQFDDYIHDVRVDRIYALKGQQYARELEKELRNGRIGGSGVVKIHRIANDIIQWLFLSKKEPDYRSLYSEILKIFYNENTAKSSFNFKFNTNTVYTLYFANGNGTLNFKLNKRAKNQLNRFYMKNKLKQTANKKKLSVTPLPSGFFLIDEEVKVHGQPTKYEDDNHLYIKLTQASFGGIIRGELYVRRGNIYKKTTPSQHLRDTKGIVRMFESDKKLVYYDASKINRELSKDYHDVRYFKNFLITKSAIKDFLKEQGSYKTDIVLSAELAKIASSQESMSEFYEYCSGHPKHYTTIKQNTNTKYGVRAIDNILQLLFERGTRLYLNSKASSSNSNSTRATTLAQKEYHIQDFSKLEEIYIPSSNSSNDGIFETLKTKYNNNFDTVTDVQKTHSIAVLDIYLSRKSTSAYSDCKTVKQNILNSSAKILRTIGKNISFKLRRFTT